MATLQVAGIPPPCDADTHDKPSPSAFDVLDKDGKVVAHACKRHAAGLLQEQEQSEYEAMKAPKSGMQVSAEEG